MNRFPFLRRALLVCLLAWLSPLAAQAPPARDAAAVAQALDRLQVLGSVLYLAAHPDDENPALLAYFAQGRHLATSYLSLTRGAGGQNRLGPERGDALAALRTQELLAARRVDGVGQYFTRAEDFGFSKRAEEALGIWGHDPALADVVWIIRKLRPDVIVTRFSPTLGETHGHHTASAILALEAFRAAADPARFPEQLAWVKPWQATRLFWNSYRTPRQLQALPPGSYLTLDAGGYAPLLGRSYSELGAESTSQHRSQGMGMAVQRGPRLEVLEWLAGQPAKTDPFEGIDCTWERVPGGSAAGLLLAQARSAYQPAHPEACVRLLLQAKAALDRLAPDPWAALKRAELLETIRCAAGIWVEAIADRQAVAPGNPLVVTATILSRLEPLATLAGYGLAGTVTREDPEPPRPLPLNEPVRKVFELAVPAGTPCTQPYWLEGPRTRGLHAAGPPELAGLAEGPPVLAVTFHLSACGVDFDLQAPVRYRLADPVLGERYQPLAVLPPVMVNLPQRAQLFAGDGERPLQLVVLAGGSQVAGTLRFQVSAGWRVEPAELPFALASPGDELRLSTRVFPPAGARTGELSVQVDTGGGPEPARGLVRIDYPHIPLQTLFPPARARLVRLELGQGGRRIGCVEGSGDEIPAALRPLGYQVDRLTDAELAEADLAGYDAIIVGIRAFNTRPALARLNPRLLDYVAGGGTEVVLYSSDQGLVTADIGPFPFRITSTRVTDPAAPVTFLAPDHPLLNRPNRITPEDFQGWVQERGSYFAEGLDARYQPILATGDPGEKPSAGSLIVARHGRGFFVYTGLSFFRQLPEGVPGAYRLFANLLALKDSAQ